MYLKRANLPNGFWCILLAEFCETCMILPSNQASQKSLTARAVKKSRSWVSAFGNLGVSFLNASFFGRFQRDTKRPTSFFGGPPKTQAICQSQGRKAQSIPSQAERWSALAGLKRGLRARGRMSLPIASSLGGKPAHHETGES